MKTLSQIAILAMKKPERMATRPVVLPTHGQSMIRSAQFPKLLMPARFATSDAVSLAMREGRVL